MLKLIYTENSFSLERLAQPMEDWVTTRVLLALRAGTNLYVEPSTASFLLPVDLPLLVHFQGAVEQENPEAIAICQGDEDHLEVSLYGSWLVSDPDSEEGIFACSLSDTTEFYLLKLWEEAQLGASVIRE